MHASQATADRHPGGEHYQEVLADLGISDDPFAPSRGPETYYASASLQQRIDLVRHLLDIGRQIVIITGPSGAGKSSMLDQILHDPPKSWLVARMTGGPTLNAATLLARVAESLGVTPSGVADPEAMIAAVRHKLVTFDHAAKAAVLAIDDIETVPSDTHRVLLELAHADQPAAELKIVLATRGDAASAAASLQPDSADRTLVHVVELPPFNPVQTRALIEHRMRASGFAGAMPFDEATIARFCRDADGIAGKIVILARQALAMGRPANRWDALRERAPSPLIIGLAGGGAALVVLAAMWFAAAPRERDTTIIELELPPVRPPAVIVAQDRGTRPDGIAKPTPRPARSAAPAAAAPGSSPESQSVTAPPVVPVPVPLPAAAPTALGTAPPAVASAADRQTRAETPPGDTARAPPAASAPAGAVSAPGRPETASAPPPVPGARATTAKPTAAKARYSVEWLQAQPPGDYVVQLFGVRDAAEARRFIEKHQLRDQAVTFATTLKRQPWYVVVSGHYATKTAALAAIAKLPPALRVAKPWPRRLDTLADAPGARR